ncbi:MAG TPA: hypothetical protein VJJ26_03675, partial [Candidatus Babeliales bacterium]|nr:hypothetical protein [Candidatus Babeliales bacterium]
PFDTFLQAKTLPTSPSFDTFLSEIKTLRTSGKRTSRKSDKGFPVKFLRNRGQANGKKIGKTI